VEKNKELFTATDWQVLLFAIKTMTVVHTKAQSQNSQSNQIKSNREREGYIRWTGMYTKK